MSFNKFEDRVSRILKVTDRIKSEQGRTVVYAANITAPAQEMLRRAEFVKEQGGKCIMIDIMTAGWSGLQYIREQNLGLIIHAHRAMHAAFTKEPQHRNLHAHDSKGRKAVRGHGPARRHCCGQDGRPERGGCGDRLVPQV